MLRHFLVARQHCRDGSGVNRPLPEQAGEPDRIPSAEAGARAIAKCAVWHRVAHQHHLAVKLLKGCHCSHFDAPEVEPGRAAGDAHWSSEDDRQEVLAEELRRR